jgi:uncharacterized protein (TIGR02246 family)
MTNPNPESDVERLTQLREEYVQAENAGDVDGILRTFSDDIVLMPPGSPAVRGRDAANNYLTDLLDTSDVTIELSSEEIALEGDLAYDWGTYSSTHTPDGGQPEQTRGTYLFVYQRESDGRWKQTEHIWNANE